MLSRRAAGAPGTAESGFTLVEIMVASLLLALLALVMATYYPNASSNSGFARNETYATLLAQRQVEELKAKTFSFVTPTNYITPTTQTLQNITFTRRVTITLCNATTTAPCPSPITSTQSPNLAVVAVTVSWQEPANNKANAVTLTTMMQNYF